MTDVPVKLTLSTIQEHPKPVYAVPPETFMISVPGVTYSNLVEFITDVSRLKVIVKVVPLANRSGSRPQLRIQTITSIGLVELQRGESDPTHGVFMWSGYMLASGMHTKVE